jgi:hypothetical protein
MLLYLLLFILSEKHCQQTGENCAMRSFAGHGAHVGDIKNVYRLWWGNLSEETAGKS